MTTRLSVTAAGDLERVNGRFVRVDSTAQRLQTRLRILLGEWWLDRNAGVPYLEQIVGRGSIAHVRQILRERILATEGVTTLDELQLRLDRATRVLTVTFAVNGGNPDDVQFSA